MDEDQNVSDETKLTADADDNAPADDQAPDDTDGTGDDEETKGGDFLRLKRQRDDIKARADNEKRKRQDATRRAEEAERKLAEYERKKLEDKQQWQELMQSHEQEREQERVAFKARSEKLQGLFREKQEGDLKLAVFEQFGIASGFLADAAFSAVLKDLPVIDDVDPDDLESLKIPGVDPQAVNAVGRRIRKVAPELFNRDSSGKGGDLPTANTQKSRSSKGPSLPPGVDPNDPEVQKAIRLAKGG